MQVTRAVEIAAVDAGAAGDRGDADLESLFGSLIERGDDAFIKKRQDLDCIDRIAKRKEPQQRLQIFGHCGQLAAQRLVAQVQASVCKIGVYISYPQCESRQLAQYANDPKETQIQYDLYRIPFNAGKGGKPEPIVGASQNGMSNSFPKVPPDGRWIVFVQSRNGMLMRPDGQLFIVPAEGVTLPPDPGDGPA